MKSKKIRTYFRLNNFVQYRIIGNYKVSVILRTNDTLCLLQALSKACSTSNQIKEHFFYVTN